MSLAPAHSTALDDFLDAVKAVEGAYEHSTFSYIALRANDAFGSVRAFIRLDTGRPAIPHTHYQSVQIRAGHYSLDELGFGLRELLQQLLTGTLPTPHGDLQFPGNESDSHSAIYFPLSPEAVAQTRLRVLKLLGGTTPSIHQPDIDWELKASQKPYYALNELLAEYILGGLPFEHVTDVQVIAFPVALVDGLASKIAGEEATVHVRLAKGLERGNLRLGYRVLTQGRVSTRDSISGDALSWTDEPDFSRGITALNIPTGAILDCTVSYKGSAQHFWLLSDPATFQNARRAAYEVADKNLELLRDIVSKALRKGDDARDFEAAIAWLFWMLGFSAVQLGHTKRTNQDAADLILCTPSGHFAVIECTTGLLKADQKLSLLYERAQTVRRALGTPQFNHLQVLPVIITAKRRAEIEADLEQAEKLGILVFAREEIDEMLNRTLTLPNPDQYYEEVRQALQAAQAKHAPNEPSPLPSSSTP